jgi:hypothetical protein
MGRPSTVYYSPILMYLLKELKHYISFKFCLLYNTKKESNKTNILFLPEKALK